MDTENQPHVRDFRAKRNINTLSLILPPPVVAPDPKDSQTTHPSNQEQADSIYSIPDLPHFDQFEYPSFPTLEDDKLNGISQFDNTTRSALLQFDIFERSTRNLSDTICQFESIAFVCQQISEFSSVSASSFLSQISKLNQTSQKKKSGVFNFLASIYRRITK